MFGATSAKINGVKRLTEAGMKRLSNLQLGFQQAVTVYKEPTATNADTIWNLGVMAASGTYVPNKNIDKGNRS
jgi:hypothetical protein